MSTVSSWPNGSSWLRVCENSQFHCNWQKKIWKLIEVELLVQIWGLFFFYLSFPFFFLCLFCYCCRVSKSCLILQNLADSSILPGSSVHIISQQQYWRVLPVPSPGDLLDPDTEPESSSLQVDSLPLSHQRSPLLSSLAKDCLVTQDRKCSF